MSDRAPGDRHETYVPPTPQHVKPKGSRDNAVEMAAGGEANQKALAARDERLASGDPLSPQPARRDIAAKTREEQMAAPETTDIEHAQRRGQIQHQEEVQQMEQSSSTDKQGKGSVQHSNHSTEASSKSAHKSSEAVSGEGVIGGSKTESATQAAAETLASAKGHIEPAMTSVTEHAQEAASDVKSHAQDAATGVKAHAQGAAADVRDHAQQAVSELKDQAQGALTGAQSEAQDRLQSVKASLQSRTDELKGTLTDKTDQLKGTLTGIPDQVKGTVSERGEQAKQAANQTVTQAGERLSGFATTLREKTQTLEPESPVTNVATKAADALEQTGSYLQQSTPDDWMSDLKRLISRKPLEAVLVAASIGYLIARAFRGGNNDQWRHLPEREAPRGN